MERDKKEEKEMKRVEEIEKYMEGGWKKKEEWRIGKEKEKFKLYKENKRKVKYGGKRGIKEIMEGMKERIGWEKIMEEGKIIGIVEKKGKGEI